MRGRGPWSYVCVVGGFRTQHEALASNGDGSSTRNGAGVSHRAGSARRAHVEAVDCNSLSRPEVPLVVEDYPLH